LRYLIIGAGQLGSELVEQLRADGAGGPGGLLHIPHEGPPRLRREARRHSL
jgi:predicted dinucleotide-binding enzyme